MKNPTPAQYDFEVYGSYYRIFDKRFHKRGVALCQDPNDAAEIVEALNEKKMRDKSSAYIEALFNRTLDED